MSKTCVLAYSGGLDTSVCAAWLRTEMDFDVVACAVDVGQTSELDGLKVRSEAAGVADLRIIDAKQEYVEKFCFPALKANALYEGRYPLVSALSRPLIAEHLVRVAREVGATTVAHGCTGKGNDQVRFESSIASLAPDLEIVAPIRLTGMRRDEAIEWAKARDIPIAVTPEKVYSIDHNLWGRAIESGPLEDPWNAPTGKDVWELTSSEVWADPTEVVIGFVGGIPVSIDDEPLAPVDLVSRIQQIAGAQGVGRIDVIENRLVGIKSREVYEAPAALSLIAAHRDLEDLVLERDCAHFKQGLEQTYARLIYNGLWFSPLREALDAFIEETQTTVTGEVRLLLHNGALRATGRRSKHSLYDSGLATYTEGDTFSHSDAEGFIRLWSLPTKTWSAKNAKS